MTEDQKYEIAVLASEYAAKAEIFKMHQQLNVSTDPVKREQQVIEYHIAETEMWQARDRLGRAKRAALI